MAAQLTCSRRLHPRLPLPTLGEQGCPTLGSPESQVFLLWGGGGILAMATLLHDHVPLLPTVATIKGRVCKANLSSAFPPLCQKANWFCNLKMQRTGNAINFMKTCSVMKSLLPTEAPSQHINLGLSHSMTKTISPAIFSVSLASYPHWILEECHLDLSSWLSFRDKYNFLCLIGDRGSGRGRDSPKVHSEAGAEERVQLQAPPASDLTAHPVPL